MEELARLQARLASITELVGVVRTLRSLAAVRLHQAEATLPAARAYADFVAGALVTALALEGRSEAVEPAAGRLRAVVVFCSEHGFVGALNRTLLDHAQDGAGGSPAVLFVVGRRGLLEAGERNLAVAGHWPMPAQPDSAAKLARELAVATFEEFAGGQVAALDLVFARIHGLAAPQINRLSILPPAPISVAPKAALPPLTNLPVAVLAGRLVEDYVVGRLALAAIEALAAENAQRVVTMTAAHDNIERRVRELERRLQQLRQEEITTELLDVVTGSEAQRGRSIRLGSIQGLAGAKARPERG